MLTRYFSPRRKIWLTSICIGVAVALLAGSIQFMVIYHNRSERFDQIINNVSHYLNSYFADLSKTIDGLQPLLDQPCEHIDSGLAASAAFSPNVRAFLLVKNGWKGVLDSFYNSISTEVVLAVEAAGTAR